MCPARRLTRPRDACGPPSSGMFAVRGDHPFWGWTWIAWGLYFWGNEYRACFCELFFKTSPNCLRRDFCRRIRDDGPRAIGQYSRVENQCGPDDGKSQPEALRVDDGGN